jgi:hypothetical protein
MLIIRLISVFLVFSFLLNSAPSFADAGFDQLATVGAIEFITYWILNWGHLSDKQSNDEYAASMVGGLLGGIWGLSISSQAGMMGIIFPIYIIMGFADGYLGGAIIYSAYNKLFLRADGKLLQTTTNEGIKM